MLLNIWKQYKFRTRAIVKTLASSNPTIFKDLLLKSQYRLMSNTDDYFRSIIYENGSKSMNLGLEDTIKEMFEYNTYHNQRKQLVRNKNKHVRKFGIKDYELDDYELDGVKTNDLVKTKAYTDPASVIDNSTQAVVFGLPYDTTEAEVKDLFEMYGLIDNVKIYEDMQGDISHAILTYKTNTALQRCKDQAKDIWIRNWLLKVKTADDAEYESLRNRTVAISNLPIWVSRRILLEMMSEIGSVVDIEFPIVDSRIEMIKESKLQQDSENKLKSTLDERMKQSEKYFNTMDEFFMNTHAKDERARQLKQPDSGNYSMPLAERILNYDQEIRKRVSSKSAVYFEKVFKSK